VTDPGEVYEHTIDDLYEISGDVPLFALVIDLVIARVLSSVWD
jgi:hypothetical protein